MVLAPESDYVRQLTTPDQEKAVAEYLDYVAKRTERERQSEMCIRDSHFLKASVSKMSFLTMLTSTWISVVSY